MHLEASVDLSGLTWGDLIDFVDAARPYVSPGDAVTVESDDNETAWVPEALSVELPSDYAPAAVRVFGGEEAHYYRVALQAVIASDGDARAVMTELTKLRDLLG